MCVEAWFSQIRSQIGACENHDIIGIDLVAAEIIRIKTHFWCNEIRHYLNYMLLL